MAGSKDDANFLGPGAPVFSPGTESWSSLMAGWSPGLSCPGTGRCWSFLVALPGELVLDLQAESHDFCTCNINDIMASGTERK